MEWFNTTVVIVAGVLALFNLLDKIIGTLNKAKEPTEDLKRRIEDLERKTNEEYKRTFENYDKKICDIEESNRVTIRALLALLKHSIDGNNKTALMEAEKEVTDYLTK